MHKIKVYGSDIPDVFETFDQLSSLYHFKNYLAKNLQEQKYPQPTPIQMQVIPIMLKEREVIGIAPTGSGKTLAFALPILATLKDPEKVGFRAIVVTPTRELASQIYREFLKLAKGRKWRICVLTKAVASHIGPESSQNFDILITTPLRLVNMIQEETINLSK